jgi:hypothetical protein
MIRKGMTIIFKPEYMDPSDENLTFIALPVKKKAGSMSASRNSPTGQSLPLTPV